MHLEERAFFAKSLFRSIQRFITNLFYRII